MRTLTVGVVGVVFLFASAAQLNAVVVAFTDGTFNDADWEIILFTAGTGGSVSGVQVGSGGSPGEYRKVTNVMNAPLPGGRSQVNGFHRRIGATYNPSTQGPIAGVDYSLDFKFISGHPSGGDGQAFGLALRQEGKVYSPPLATTGLGTSWTPSALSGLEQGDFGRWVVTATHIDRDPGQNPDFTAAGLPIEWGFATANGGWGDLQRIAGYDNWSVMVTPVPEPSSIIVWCVGAVGLLAYACGKRP